MTTNRTSARSLERALVGALLALVLILRLVHLDDAGLWEDEAHSFALARGDREGLVLPQRLIGESRRLDGELDDLGTTTELFDGLRHESSYGPIYYALVYATMRWGGVRDVEALKLWNVLFGTLTALFLWALARQGLSLAGATTALLLFAFSAWDLSVSLQLKGFALATLATVSASYFLCRLVSAPAGGRLAYGSAYAIALALGLLSHAFVLLVLALHGVWAIVTLRRLRRTLPWITAAAVALALTLPWVLFAGADQAAFERKSAAAKDRLRFVGLDDLWEALSNVAARNLLPTGEESLPGIVLLLVLAAALLAGASGLLARDDRTRRLSWLAGLLALGPVPAAAVYAVAEDSMNALWPRYFVIFLPFAWIAIAAAIEGATPSRPGARAAAVFAVIVFCCGQEWAFRELGPFDRRFDWRSGAEAVAADAGELSLIVHSPGGANVLAFAHHWPGDNRHTVLVEPTAEVVARIVEDARGAPIWFILSWRRQEFRDPLEHLLEPHGYALARTIPARKVLMLRFDPYREGS